MRLLRNICLLIVPVLLIINLYRFVMYNDDYAFRGFAYVHQYMSTFPGLSGTFNLIEQVQTTVTEFTSIKVESLLDVFDAITKFFALFGMVFSVPLMIVVDVARSLWWVISMFVSN